MLRSFKALKVWKKSYDLCLKAYRITAAFPKDELYGLTSQIKRSAVSIPSNIAEGYGRKTTVDYVRFLYIAYGSTCELETQILLAGDLDFIDTGNLGETLGSVKEVERMLKTLISERPAAVQEKNKVPQLAKEIVEHVPLICNVQ